MTLDEFIEKLAGTKGLRWHLAGQAIRTLDCQCPMEAATDCAQGEVARAARLLQISTEDYCAIIDAADCCKFHDAALRARLLEAVGLKP